MNKDFFDIKNIKDFVRLLVFFIVSPVIGTVMLIGMIATSTAMVCMYIDAIVSYNFINNVLKYELESIKYNYTKK